MGARVEGKRKKKSKKVAVTSKFNGKRKLSRMGKKVKKGKMGPSTDFKTRSYVLKALQISLKDFRRLCILKGIYPRVPSKPPKGADKIYYDIKDITYLSHEPLLAKFREFKSFMKKIRKAAGRNQISEARRKDRLKPVMTLNHLVKERYPRFIDALRDMDDALCMVHLFASLASSGRVTAERTTACSNLSRHWQYYVAKSKSLKKVFVSVKGVYFQAEVMGEAITWLVPHQFTQVVPREVDLRVMMTFLEFYEVFLKFALFKLYHMEGLRYPPVMDPSLHDAGCVLFAVKTTPLEATGTTAVGDVENTNSNTSTAVTLTGNKKPAAASAQQLASLKEKLSHMESREDDEDVDEEDEDDQVPIAGPLADAFAVIGGDSNDAFAESEEEHKTFKDFEGNADSNAAAADHSRKLFKGLKFFINREVPLDWMQLCILSKGGIVGWDGEISPYGPDDPSITHHVVDRPMQGNAVLSREYVQPQWVFDSINADFLLPVASYRPGAKLPPHLSPFVDNSREGYVPLYQQQVDQLKAEAGLGGGVSAKGRGNKEELDDVDEDAAADIDDETEEGYAANIRAERRGRGQQAEDDESEEGSDDEDDDEDDESDEEDEEEEAVPVAKKIPGQAKKGPKSVVFAGEELSEVSSPCCLSMSQCTVPFIKGSCYSSCWVH